MRRFLIDNQLPKALVSWLEGKDCSARHVLTMNLAQASDEAIWLQAAHEMMVIVSKDEDFARLSIMRQEQVPVLWLRMGNCRSAALIDMLERAWPRICEQLDADARLIEVQ